MLVRLIVMSWWNAAAERLGIVPETAADVGSVAAVVDASAVHRWNCANSRETPITTLFDWRHIGRGMKMPAGSIVLLPR
jgi:hypothetical protein